MASVALTPKQKSDAQKDIVQEAAVRKVVKHFKSHNRGQLAMFCGTGKTRTAIKAIKRLKSRVVVVCVPTLGLASQWINDFAKYGDKRELLAVCSKLHNETPEDYGIVGYTTNKDVVRAFARSKGKLLIVSTYQSYDVIQAAWRRTKLAPIDLLIADEAHNTAGKNSKHMGLCLHDSGAKVVKRLFMTATRRLYRGDKDDYNCMDDTEVYGDVIYELTLREAIDRGIVSDYAVYVINVYNDLRPEDFANINSSGFESELLAKFVSEKIMKDKAVRVFTFHNRVDDATEFAQHIEASGKWAKVLTGEHKVKDREAALRTFESHEKSSLIASVNVLGEGIDVPSVDVIVFADKMTEPQAIIQRMGRGTRIVDGKKKLRIILPICVSPTMSELEVSECAYQSRHKDALNVIRALATYDPTFYRNISEINKIQCDSTNGFSATEFSTIGEMLSFDGVDYRSLSARLMPMSPWPDATDGMECIERAVHRFIFETGNHPTQRSGTHLCPELFPNWRSASAFLTEVCDEPLSHVRKRITGVELRHNGNDAVSCIKAAFSAFVLQYNRAPTRDDETTLVPNGFSTWQKVENYLISRDLRLSRIAVELGIGFAKDFKPSCSDLELEALSRAKLSAYVGEHGKLPHCGHKFLFGKTLQWFIKHYRSIYFRIRRDIGPCLPQTEDSIIEDIKAFYAEHSRPPSCSDMKSQWIWCKNRSISFCKLVEKSGVPSRGEYRTRTFISSIIGKIRTFKSGTKRNPTTLEMLNESKYVLKHKPFGISSWPEFVDHVLSMPASQKATK